MCLPFDPRSVTIKLRLIPAPAIIFDNTTRRPWSRRHTGTLARQIQESNVKP